MERVQSLTQAYSQAPWRKQMQIAGLISLVLVFAALVAGIYLNVSARSATIGRDIQRMQADIETTSQTNADLQSQLAFLTSAEQMEKRARNLGFRPVQMDQPLFILVPDYTAREPVVLAPAPQPVVLSVNTLPPEYTESLLVWLQRELWKLSLPWLEVKP